MLGILNSDRRAVRACILHEALQTKSMYKSFQDLSNVLGYDFMDFQQFEHFYRRYEKGEIDLEYDGRPEFDRNLSDMPIVVMKNIISHLDVEGKWLFRATSPSIGDMVDPTLPECRYLEIILEENLGELFFNTVGSDEEYQAEYFQEENQVDMIFNNIAYSMNCGHLVDAMVTDIRRLIDHSKTTLRGLHLQINCTESEDVTGSEEKSTHHKPFIKEMKPILHSLTNLRKLSIEFFSMNQIQWILRNLKPGILKIIELYSSSQDVDDGSMVTIFGMKQWKEAEIIDFSQFQVFVPVQHFIHLKKFFGAFRVFTPKNVLEIKEEMAKGSTLIKCQIVYTSELDFEKVNELLGPLNDFEIQGPMDEENQIRHFQVLNSTDYIRISFSNETVRFYRIKSLQDSEELYFDPYDNYTDDEVNSTLVDNSDGDN